MMMLNVAPKFYSPQISGSLAHRINGIVQLGGWDLSGIGHVFRQKILVSRS
jgi:hypothetical protein